MFCNTEEKKKKGWGYYEQSKNANANIKKINV